GGIFAAKAGAAGAESASIFDNARASMEQTNYLLSIVPRLEIWALITPGQGLLGVVVPIAILLAILAARHRVLENPREHLKLLRVTAIVGISVGWVTGAVVAAQNL